MNTEFLESQLKHKERSVNDLVRFIKTKAGNLSNFTLLIGAGCSITSGIRSAQTLSEAWLRELYHIERPDEDSKKVPLSDIRSHFVSKHSSWYNPLHEYSSLFEKRYDLPTQRRAFIEEEVAGKFPSIGYAYLIKLIESHFFNTVFTTNFDDLLNESFHLFSENSVTRDSKSLDLMRPIVCAHDSSVKSMSVTSSRPKIIKLHGDFLFDDIKSTLRETESLEENIRNKFVEFCKEFGLLVVGYAGSDRSVMDVINYLLKSEDYLKNGLYWCIRRGDEISEELSKLLWKDRVYYIYIDGFDELFAELYQEIIGGAELPIPRSLPNKNDFIIEHLFNNAMLKTSKSKILHSALARLESELKKNSFFNNVKDVLFPEGKISDFQGFSSDETFELFEINKLQNEKRYEEAIVKIEDMLIQHDYSFEFKNRLQRSAADILHEQQKYDECIRHCDALITNNGFCSNAFFFKDSFLLKYEDRIANMRKCLEYNPANYECYERIASCEYDLLSRTYESSARDDVRIQLLDDVEHGITANPYIENQCFQTKFLLYASQRESLDKNWESVCNDIINSARGQCPDHPLCFYYDRLLILSKAYDEKTKKEKLGELWDKLSTKLNNKLEQYIEEALKLLDSNIVDQGKIDFARCCLENSKKRLEKNYNYLRTLHSFYATYCGEVSVARNILLTFSDDKFTLHDLYLLKAYSELLNDTDVARTIMERIRADFSPQHQLEIERLLLRMNHRYDGVIPVLNEMDKYKKSEHENFNQFVYAYLEAGKFEEAYKVSNAVFNEITTPDGRECRDLINYELARKLIGKKPRKEVLNSIIAYSDSNSVRAAAFILLEKYDDANKIIEKDVRHDFLALHFYEDTFIFKHFANEKMTRILRDAHSKIK